MRWLAVCCLLIGAAGCERRASEERAPAEPVPHEALVAEALANYERDAPPTAAGDELIALGDAAVPALRRELERPRHIRALRALTQIGTPAAAEAIVLWEGSDFHMHAARASFVAIIVRHNEAITYADFSAPVQAALPELLADARSPRDVLDVIERLGPHRFAPVLRKLARSEHPEDRERAAALLEQVP